MTKDLATTDFDYDGIDKDVKGKLINLAGQFNNKMRSYKKSWLDLGEIVSDAHELLSKAGRDSRFASWIESFLNVSRQTAYRYMWAWERFGNCNSVEQFTTEALYELAGPNTPEKAVKEAIKLADKGKKITKSLSSELVEKHTVDSNATRRAADSESAATDSGEDDGMDSSGKTPQEPGPRPPRSGKDQPGGIDYGKCPNCSSTKLTSDEFGAVCAKCGQPHGEPIGDRDEDQVKVHQKKWIKTIEADIRAADDMNDFARKPKEHDEVIKLLKQIYRIAKDWLA